MLNDVAVIEFGFGGEESVLIELQRGGLGND